MKSKLLGVFSLLVIAQTSQAVEQIIPTDSSGNHNWNDTHFRVEKDKITPVDAYGNRKWNNVHYRIKGNKTIPTDAYGNRIWNQEHFTNKK